MNKVFHNLIVKALAQPGYDHLVPNVTKKYPVKTGVVKPVAKDLKVFEQLYLVKPDQITGNGEVALYWLYNYTADNRNQDGTIKKEIAKSTQGDNAPDLMIGGVNVEVKAYKNFDKAISLGRFQSQKDFRAMVGMLFSAGNFLNEANYGELKFDYFVLKEAAEAFCQFRQAVFDNNLDNIPVFKKMAKQFRNFDALAKQNGLDAICYKAGRSRPGGKVIATELVKFILRQLMGQKPGDGGFMCNVTGDKTSFDKNGGIEYYKISIDNMVTDDSVLESRPKVMDFNGAFFYLNFKKLFPK